jgi:hypothetical protein
MNVTDARDDARSTNLIRYMMETVSKTVFISCVEMFY